MVKFIIFHQPKIGGSYAKSVLPKNYVLDHYKNYHYCLTQKYNFTNIKLVCIIREPIDYYISIITFWCLDPKYNKKIKNNSINKLKNNYNLKINKKDNYEHPAYWFSKGFTERNLINILNNLFDEKFINNNIDKLSKNHHTYDNYVFKILDKLDIGYYTFAFLDQYSRKKVSEIKDSNECKEEINYIKNNFLILNNKNLTKELKNLCKKYNVLFTKKSRKMVSNRKRNINEYNIDDILINKIKYKDRYMFELFKNY
jgi:hypothetical protein